MLLTVIEDPEPVCFILDDVADFDKKFYSLQNYYGYFQINRLLDINRLIEKICKMCYHILVQRYYEKVFSSEMNPKIWLGRDGSPDSEPPPFWTLVFARY